MYLLWKMEWHKIFYTRVSRDIINLWGKINYQYLLRQVFTSVVYDKVRNRKNYFEIPVYLLIEWGISKAGKFKVLLHFPAPEFACIFVFIWISGLKNQKGGTSKIIFPIPSYITQGRHSNQCHRAMALVTFLVSKYQKSRICIDNIIKSLEVALLNFHSVWRLWTC